MKAKLKISDKEIKTLLSTLWIFVILNMFARDIHELGRPGMLEQVMSGVVDGVTITEGLMLLGGIMFEIFLVMVVLSQVLKHKDQPVCKHDHGLDRNRDCCDDQSFS